MYGEDKRLNHEKGERGEELAAAYLRGCGYTILSRHYRFHRREIDIVAREGGCYVFIEVKARSSTLFGYSYQAVDRTKQRSIRMAAEDYLLRHQLSLYETPCRFDIISVDGGTLRHYKNAF